MVVSRRFFLGGLVAAPAIIAIDNLMPVRPWMPVLYGDGIHDDWAGLQALVNGEAVDIRAKVVPAYLGAPELGFTSMRNTYSLSRELLMPANTIRRDHFMGDHFLKRSGFSDSALISGPLIEFEPGHHHSTWQGVYIGEFTGLVDNQLTS